MYNPQKVIEFLNASGYKKKELLDYLGKNWNGSIDAVIRGDIRASKLEKIADFFGVPIDSLFDRQVECNTVVINGNKNRLGNFSFNPASDCKHMEDLLQEKDRRIELLEEMISMLKMSKPTK